MNSRLHKSESLHARAVAFVRAFERNEKMPESFDVLGSDLARFQAENVAGYARLCHARGIDPKAIARASDAPAVPTDAFKMGSVFAFDDADATITFRTSGTTIGARGSHRTRDVSTYDAAALAFGRASLAANASRIPVLVLGPSPANAPDSSLTHMIALFAREFGTPADDASTYFIDNDVIDIGAFDERVARLLVAGDDAALVLGTSFAFVHFLDALGDDVFRLPPKTRVMQTGGFKGKSREVDAETLRRDLARAFAIEPRSIISEYGMTELSSQFYESSPNVFCEPPWARVVPVDPDSLEPVREGEIGIARIEDLMNVDSAFAVLTSDRVRRVSGGFELLGRAPGAPPRGCSIAIDEMLGR
jgi:hypothetical protein